MTGMKRVVRRARFAGVPKGSKLRAGASDASHAELDAADGLEDDDLIERDRLIDVLTKADASSALGSARRYDAGPDHDATLESGRAR